MPASTEYIREWRKRNREKYLAYQRTYNRNKHRAKWYQKNKEALKLQHALQLKTIAEARALLERNDKCKTQNNSAPLQTA